MPRLFEDKSQLPWWVNTETMKPYENPYGPQYPPCDNMSIEQFHKDFDGNILAFGQGIDDNHLVLP